MNFSREVGGTVVFPCNSNEKEIKAITLQGGKNCETVIIAYRLNETTKNDTFRPDTDLNHKDKTVTLKNLKVSDEGKYKCIINHGVGGGVTKDTNITLNITGRPPFTHSHSQQEHW